jgi:hypothetical protein
VTRFEYTAGFPGQIRQIVEPHLIRYSVLIPSWVEYIRVEYESTPKSDDAATAACMQTWYEYRRAVLTIFPQHIDSPADYQERTIIHELLHLVNELQRKCLRDLTILATEAKPDLADYVREQIRVANESQTEDLQNIIWKLTHAAPS